MSTHPDEDTTTEAADDSYRDVHVLVVEYDVIEKPNPKDLSILERLLTRNPRINDPIPGRTVVDSEWRPTSTGSDEGPVRPASPSDRVDG